MSPSQPPKARRGASPPSSGPPSPSDALFPHQILASVLVPSRQEPGWDRRCQGLTPEESRRGLPPILPNPSTRSSVSWLIEVPWAPPSPSRASLQASAQHSHGTHSFLQPPALEEGSGSFQLLFAPVLSPPTPPPFPHSLPSLHPNLDSFLGSALPQPPPSKHLPDPRALTLLSQ